ncbi:MAG: DegT/DnrJ/EryC1/StrS family aminotransferase [Gemmatimonadetes bacterium]|nr:DegT/DnrJ/EryC1/StrS family aminotransferase [Gemmatimonadota bacterium]
MDRSTSTTRDVPFFNYRGAFAEIEAPLVAVIRDVISRGAFIMQRDLKEFEAACGAFLGVKHAFGVANATDGLHMALRAAGIKPGDEVIFPSHTMVASPAAVHFAGGVPVPVDIGRDRLIDPELVERAITSRTRFIMPVHVNGRSCDMRGLGELATRYGLQIIEDAAQALGSRFEGRYAGTFGSAGVYSFYPAKVLGCLGDGGLVVTNDDGIAARLHELRDHGRDRDGNTMSWGLNSRLDNLQAAVLHLQFKTYESVIRRRRELAAAYHRSLSDVPELVLPAPPHSDPARLDVYQNYEIEAESRDELREFLKGNGVGTLIQWGGAAVHQISALGFAARLPVTERFFTRCLMLPLNMMVTDDDVRYTVAAIRRFYRR